MGAGPRGNKDAKHVRIYDGMQMSAAWRSLSGNAVKLLLHVASFEKGDNNGSLFCSAREAAEGIGVTKNTALAAFHQLEDRGFLRPTEKGHFHVKGGPATCWRLTWRSSPATRQSPTNEWRDWKPDQNKSRAQKLTDTGAKSAPDDESESATGVKIAPAHGQKPRKSVKPVGANIDTHTVASGSSAPSAPPEPHLNEAALRRSARTVAKDRGTHAALAIASGIHRDVLDDFIHRSACLPDASLARLNRALKSLAT